MKRKFLWGFIAGMVSTIIIIIVAIMIIIPSISITNEETSKIDINTNLPAQHAIVTAIDASTLKNKIDSLKGHPIVVNIWATWCAPCMNEIPVLLDFKKKYENDSIKFIFISADPQRDKQIKIAERLLTKKGITFETYIINKNPSLNPMSTTNIDEFITEIGLKDIPKGAVPCTIYIDKNGNKINYTVGFPKDTSYVEEAKKEIEKNILSIIK